MKRKWFAPKGLASRTSVLTSAFAATLLILGTAGAAAAQDGAVAGRVTSETGETLQGVQVFIPGTSFGTLSDEGGRYRLTGIPVGQHTLRASIIGYQGSEQLVTVTAGEVATVDFVLPVSAVALDEVVATITGERRRRELATDISTVDAVVVQEGTRSNDINTMLKGQASGIVVRKSSGTVGTGSDVRIRGTGSISLSNQPLYVIDGAIIDSQNNANSPVTGGIGAGGQDFSRLNDLNPDEIESVEIIKGPAASALWGARGNAGVILITTKKGGGETRWNARADLGFARSTEDFWASAWDPRSLLGPAATDTVWTQDLLNEFDPFRDGLYQNYNMNVNGGAGVWNYFGSVQYNNEKGTLPNNQQEKFNFRANFNVDPSDNLSISFSNGYASTEARLPDNDNNGFGYLGVALIGFPWNHPETLADPVTGETVLTCPISFELSKLTGSPASAFACPENSFFGGRTFDDVETLVNNKEVERYTGSGNVTWNPLPRWTNRFTLGYDQVNDNSLGLVPVNPDRPFQTFSLGDIVKPNTTSRNITIQGTTSYDLDLSSSLNFEGIGGVQWFRQTLTSVRADGQVFPATGPAVNNAVTNQATDGFVESKSIGFFLQGQFGWKDRLFVNGSIRWDNNSAQGENLGVQSYPKFGASIVALEGHSFFNMLKFRASYGESAKLPGTNDALALVGIRQVSFQGGDELGITPDRPGNPQLQPETGEEFEAGVDMAFLRDRVGLVLTYYDQTTSNTVVSKNLAPSIGFPNALFTNIGELENKGFEVELDALVLDKEKVSWDWRFILARNQNEVTELVDPIIFGLGGSSQRHQQGLPFGSFVQELVVIGDDGNAKVLTCAETPGSWGPLDAQAGNEGSKQDFCDPLDNNRWNGQANPLYEGSVQTTLTLFKYVTLYALLDFQTGFEVLNNNGDFQCGFLGGGQGGGICPDIFEKNSDGTFTDEAKKIHLASAIGSESPFVRDGDWAKLRVVQARFEMPQSVAKFFKLSGMSFSFIGENLATFTGYTDSSQTALDPEINFGGQGEATRSEFLTLPVPKRFIGTVNLYF